jgi:hypothetical protein
MDLEAPNPWLGMLLENIRKFNRGAGKVANAEAADFFQAIKIYGYAPKRLQSRA